MQSSSQIMNHLPYFIADDFSSAIVSSNDFSDLFPDLNFEPSAHATTDILSELDDSDLRKLSRERTDGLIQGVILGTLSSVASSEDDPADPFSDNQRNSSILSTHPEILSETSAMVSSDNNAANPSSVGKKRSSRIRKIKRPQDDDSSEFTSKRRQVKPLQVKPLTDDQKKMTGLRAIAFLLSVLVIKKRPN